MLCTLLSLCQRRPYLILKEIALIKNLKRTVSWNVMPCSLVGIYQSLRGTFCRRLPWRWIQHVIPKPWYISTTVRCHTPKKTVLLRREPQISLACSAFHFTYMNWIAVFFMSCIAGGVSNNVCILESSALVSLLYDERILTLRHLWRHQTLCHCITCCCRVGGYVKGLGGFKTNTNVCLTMCTRASCVLRSYSAYSMIRIVLNCAVEWRVL